MLGKIAILPPSEETSYKFIIFLHTVHEFSRLFVPSAYTEELSFIRNTIAMNIIQKFQVFTSNITFTCILR